MGAVVMKIDFATLAFGYKVKIGGGTPNWATALGQGKDHKINNDPAIDEMLKGIIYSSVPLEKVSTKIGKGGKMVKGTEPESPIVIASVFSNVFINGIRIDSAKFILLITRDTSASHTGRLRFKYGPSNTYENDGLCYTNQNFYDQVKQQFGLADNACWYVTDISVEGQDKLCMTAVVVDKYGEVEYEDSASLHKAWGEFEPTIEKSIVKNEKIEEDDYSIVKLGKLLSDMYNSSNNKTTAIHMFGIKYAPVIKEKGYSAVAIVNESGIGESYHVEVSKGIRIYEAILANEYGITFYNGEQVPSDNVEDKVRVLPHREPRKDKSHSLNSIIYGAPGTGKTYSTAEYALAIIEGISLKEFKGKNVERSVVMEKYSKLIESEQIVFTTFHQSYGYEEFIQGLRPDTKSENLSFKTVDGVFKRIADKALNDSNNNYVIIIDEINRANISKVFGELITLIEEDKRWGELNQTSATLQSGDLFTVPNNLYIVGTMNSADKSISLIDAALRRRFEFIQQKPDASLVSDPTMRDVLEKLNKALVSQFDSADLLIGHSYFMNKTEDELPKVLNNSIIPLLYEYFYDNKKKVMSVLGDSLKNTNCAVEDDQLGRIFIERQKIRNDS